MRRLFLLHLTCVALALLAACGDAPALVVTAEPSSLEALAGERAEVRLVVRGARERVVLDAAGLPRGIEPDFAPAALDGDGAGTLGFTIEPNVPPATYPVTVTAASDGSRATTVVHLEIRAERSRELALLGAEGTYPVAVWWEVREDAVTVRVDGVNRRADASVGTAAAGDAPVVRAPPLRAEEPPLGEIILAAADAAAVAAQHGLVVADAIDAHTVVARVPEGRDLQAVLDRLRADARVRFAEPNGRLAPLEDADADRSAGQWGPQAVGAPAAWWVERGEPVVIAVIDSGIDPTHPDVAARIVPGADFCAGSGDDACGTSDQDPSVVSLAGDAGHGTHVAGIALAAADDRFGVAGVAPRARLLPIKVFDDEARPGTAAALAKALRWAVGLPVSGMPENANPAHVVNMSLRSPDSSLVREALAEARAEGAVLVAATGNGGRDTIDLPAAAEGVIGVGAVDGDGRLAWFSNTGSGGALGPGVVDLVAPGVGILSTVPAASGGWATKSGTSMAAPHVAAAAALVLAREPGLTAAAVEARLRETAYFDASSMTADGYGAGLLRADGALGLPAPRDPDTRRAEVSVTLVTAAGTSGATAGLDLLTGEGGEVRFEGVAYEEPRDSLAIELRWNGRSYAAELRAE